jgi:RNA polymerase sigma-70 factor, ECF subfamily
LGREIAADLSVIGPGAQFYKGGPGTMGDQTEDPGERERLLERIRAGDRQAAAELLPRYRDRLRRMIDLRLDARLHRRLDASDIVQDALLDIASRLDEYVKDPKLPFFLWMRMIAGDRLLRLHRQHLGAKMRDLGREVSLYKSALPAASSFALASMLLGRLTSATQAAVRAERLLRIQEALNALEPIDREVLALRHFEQLSPAETATALGLRPDAASKQYIRALKRRKQALVDMPGGLEAL